MKKQYITESCWAFPNGADGLRELKSLMDDPIPMKDATRMIYNIVGDDSLFDELGNMAEINPDQDARGIICNKICKMIEDGGFYEDDNYRDEIYNFCRAIGKELMRPFNENLDRVKQLAGLDTIHEEKEIDEEEKVDEEDKVEETEEVEEEEKAEVDEEEEVTEEEEVDEDEDKVNEDLNRMRYLAGLGLAEMEEVDEEDEVTEEEEVDEDDKVEEETEDLTEKSAPIKHFLRNYQNASKGLTLVQEKMNNKCGLHPSDVNEDKAMKMSRVASIVEKAIKELEAISHDVNEDRDAMHRSFPKTGKKAPPHGAGTRAPGGDSPMNR